MIRSNGGAIRLQFAFELLREVERGQGVRLSRSADFISRTTRVAGFLFDFPATDYRLLTTGY